MLYWVHIACVAHITPADLCCLPITNLYTSCPLHSPPKLYHYCRRSLTALAQVLTQSVKAAVPGQTRMWPCRERRKCSVEHVRVNELPYTSSFLPRYPSRHQSLARVVFLIFIGLICSLPTVEATGKPMTRSTSRPSLSSALFTLSGLWARFFLLPCTFHVPCPFSRHFRILLHLLDYTPPSPISPI